MLITKEVETRCNVRTKEYYESLGYIYTKHNEKFVVKIEDLHKGSNQYIEFKCDECDEVVPRKYKNFIKNKEKYGKELCGKCIHKIASQIRVNKNSEHENDNYGRWATHEKRKNELDNYLIEYKTLDKMTQNTDGNRLYNGFKKNNDDIYNTAIELGYDLWDIMSSKPKNYYVNNPDILINRINDFIAENNRFPTIRECAKDLKINIKLICEKGGISYLKKFMNYNEPNDLIDNRGDSNKSMGELIVANYLISQGLKDNYKREKYPFPKSEGRYRSDFSFYLENNKEIYIEVWGFRNTKEHNIEYHKVRKKKEELYKKYEDKLILIGIEYKIFDLKYDDIQKELYKIFSPFLKLKYKNITYNSLISPCLLSDEAIFKALMEISPDGITAPLTIDLLKYKSGLYTQILKRGYSYPDFIKMFGGKLKIEKTAWTNDLIFEYFKLIINNGDIINKKTMHKANAYLDEVTNKRGGMIKLKIQYFEKINEIPQQELQWAINLVNKKTGTTANYTDEDVKNMQNLLHRLYPNMKIA